MNGKGWKALRRAIGRYVAIVIVAILALVPVYWMVTMAFKPQVEWTTPTVHWVPYDPTWENFGRLFGMGKTSAVMTMEQGTATPSIINSLIIGVASTAISTVIGTLAAFGVSRYRAGGNTFPFLILQMRMIPPIAIVLPIMVMWMTIGLRDTHLGLILIYGGATFPFVVWLMKSFFDEIPRELDAAAMADGCSRFEVFTKVVLPLAKGGLSTTALFVFILNWSEFAFAFILTDRDAITIPVQLAKYASAIFGQLYGIKAALGTIAIIPPVVFGLMIQKYLVRGLTFGALKK